MAKAKRTFAVGDKVAWARGIAHLFGSKTEFVRSAVLAVDPTAEFGKVIGSDPDTGWPEVELEDGSKRHLTGEELIKIESDESEEA